MSIHPSRRVRWCLAGALVLAGPAAQLALADTVTPQSTAGCTVFTDPSGDANAEFDNVGPSDPDVDITSVAVTSPPGKIRFTIHVLTLGAPAIGIGDRFDATFTLNGHTAEIFGGHDTPATLEAVRAVGNPIHPLSGVTYDGITVGTPEVVYDAKTSTVELTADLAPLVKAAGFLLPDGAQVTDVAATSGYDALTSEFTTDNAKPATADAATYTFGATPCAESGPAPSASPTPTATDTPTPTPTPTETPTPSGEPQVLMDRPRAGCAAFTDPTGDAAPSPLGNDPDLDLMSAAFKTDQGVLSTFVHVAALGDSAALPFDGHRFSMSFTAGGKAIAFSADGAGPASATVAGAASTVLKPTAVFDKAHSNVVFTVALSDLATVTGGASSITDPTITSAALITEADEEFPADSAAGTTAAQKTYSLGDNSCFIPPPGVLTIDADSSGEYSDGTEITATLKDADGTAVPGVAVKVGFQGSTLASGTTDSDGAVDLTVPITHLAGAATLLATFAGDTVVGPAQATSAFSVLMEKTALTATGSKGTVTAVLRDDDKTPVAGVSVTFTVGKRTTTVKTDSKGTARLTKLTKGTSVTVGFAGVSGRYAAAKKVTAKAT